MNTQQTFTEANRDIFLSLLRSSLWGELRFPFEPTHGIDWSTVYSELNLHSVRNLPSDLLVQHDPDRQDVYLQVAYKGTLDWHKLMRTQQDICQILSDHQIAHAVIKGASADYYYPQPSNRAMGDIDLIVRREDLEQAVSILLDHGCSLHDNRNPRHVELKKNGIAIEIHRHFAALSDLQRAGQIDQYLFNAVELAEPVLLDGYRFSHLPKLERGLVFLEHINLHMDKGLGFRQIIDWMMYVDRELDDQFWQEVFEATAQQVGLKPLAITVTRMCQLYLGLSDELTWCRNADPDLCAALLDHIMLQGNFGKKNDNQVAAASHIMTVITGDLNLFQMLHRQGCYNWKALRKHPWLKPFAWLYQLCRYIRRGTSGSNWLRNLFLARKKKQHDTELLDRLGVHRANLSLKHEE